ncbi:hypothetical protein HK103_004344 [Boothiomyces macroporosus]|uniref:Uncharacterized protein n=1 Tax=Boothiomyces macroporosus TaxID=261099 RepID=A0AAD5UGU2_9FUNG|nr:hypothetical protein HK103_004344 [Boothiomyces macroporosus]
MNARWFSSAKKPIKVDLEYIRRYQLKHLPEPLGSAPPKATVYSHFCKKFWQTAPKGTAVTDAGIKNQIKEKWQSIDPAEKKQLEKEVEELNATAAKGKSDIVNKLSAGDYLLLQYRARLSRAVGKRAVIQKDPTLPARPSSVFSKFVKYSFDNESDLISKYGSAYRDAKVVEKMKIIAKEYKSANSDLLKKFNDEYAKEKEEFVKQTERYNKDNAASVEKTQNLIAAVKKEAIAKYKAKVRKETGEKPRKVKKATTAKAKKPKIKPAKSSKNK